MQRYEKGVPFWGTPYKKIKEKLKTKGFPWRSRRRLRHQRGHDGGSRDGIHRAQKWCAVGGSLPLWECFARSDAGAVERIIRIVHLVSAEDSLQTTLIECLVMGYEGKPLDQWLYLFPDFREDGGILCVLTCETMHLGTPIIIIIGLRLDERVEGINNLAISDDNHTNGADTGTLVVGSLKIYCCKVSHIQPSLYLFHMCFEISATSSRNHLGSITSISLPCERTS